MDLSTFKKCDHFIEWEKIGFRLEKGESMWKYEAAIYYDEVRDRYIIMCMRCMDEYYNKIFKGHPYIEIDLYKWPEFLFTDNEEKHHEKLEELREKTIKSNGNYPWDL